MLNLTIDDKINLLERKLSDQQKLVIKISKYSNYKIIGKYFYPKLIKEKEVMSDIKVDTCSEFSDSPIFSV